MVFFNFFRKQTLRDKLLNLDVQITNLEESLVKLSGLQTSFNRLGWIGIIILFPVGIYQLYLFVVTGSSTFPLYPGLLISFGLFVFYFVISFLFNLFINRLNSKIQSKKAEQSSGIEQLKQDHEYDEMLRIINKYESNLMKNKKKPKRSDTFSGTNSQSTISSNEKGKNSSVISANTTFANKLSDKLTNMLLLNNPSEMIALICKECGEHNGLVYSKQYRPFKCMHCKTYNDTEDLHSEEEVKEIISRKDEN